MFAVLVPSVHNTAMIIPETETPRVHVHVLCVHVGLLCSCLFGHRPKFPDWDGPIPKRKFKSGALLDGAGRCAL